MKFKLSDYDRWLEGFHSEWVTMGHHRIWLNVRCGFPSKYHRRLLEDCAEVCKDFPLAQIVNLYNDDGTGSFTKIDVMLVPSFGQPEARSVLETQAQNLGNKLTRIYEAKYVGDDGMWSPIYVEVNICPPIRGNSDNYDRAEWAFLNTYKRSHFE